MSKRTQESKRVKRDRAFWTRKRVTSDDGGGVDDHNTIERMQKTKHNNHIYIVSDIIDSLWTRIVRLVASVSQSASLIWSECRNWSKSICEHINDITILQYIQSYDFYSFVVNFFFSFSSSRLIVIITIIESIYGVLSQFVCKICYPRANHLREINNDTSQEKRQSGDGREIRTKRQS